MKLKTDRVLNILTTVHYPDVINVMLYR